ncbi:hypothetical protein GCM10012275_42870 [Longimycelium tulufanense]|uniref:DNA primase/polymerase bifunctional N-terminal domain-containing protein n=1 Tax=Longimycelium tulufanense TaxID=907463 RepID=A0A8J3FVZ9_9PSEU|nr:bifunctional DNA primase/polymerase [Longimycelium tulufanense]GGM67711.1 hypothetical protein GCM10012275_42870 [Longimycelium tulufanense]
MSLPATKTPPATRESPRPRLMRVALATARAGHFVVPLWPRSKKPAVSDWEAVATRDPEVIRSWWQQLPYNVGIACGPSRLLVIDLDDGHGQDPPPEWAEARHGRDVLARLAEANGQPYPGPTYTVRSPTGGLHLYFRAPDQPPLRSTQGRLGWRIDTRGAGGCIVAAGSVRAEGSYRAQNRAPIAPLPDWLVARLTPPPPLDPTPVALDLPPDRAGRYLEALIDHEIAAVRTAPTGQRHHTLLRAAIAFGRLVAGGELTDGEARTALRHAAAVHTGVDDWTASEAERTITDGLRYGALRPRHINDH